MESLITNWADAVRHYDSALALFPADKVAGKNRAMTMTYLKRLAGIARRGRTGHPAIHATATARRRPAAGRRGRGRRRAERGRRQGRAKNPATRAKAKRIPNKDGSGDEGDKDKDGKKGKDKDKDKRRRQGRREPQRVPRGTRPPDPQGKRGSRKRPAHSRAAANSADRRKIGNIMNTWQHFTRILTDPRGLALPVRPRPWPDHQPALHRVSSPAASRRCWRLRWPAANRPRCRKSPPVTKTIASRLIRQRPADADAARQAAGVCVRIRRDQL